MPGLECCKVEPRIAPVFAAEMSLRNQPAEVRVALRRLGENRLVRTVEQGQLRTGDRLEAELFRFLRERHRAVQPVVVGERERGVAELRRGERELLGERSAVEERKRRVAVKFDVHNAECRIRSASAQTTLR